MLIPPLITVDDFYRGARKALRLEANEPQLRPKPRVSSIMNDARLIAYSMANTPPSNEQRGDAFLSAEQGRQVEDMTIAALGGIGLGVTDRQVSLPDDYPLTGHPDGRMMVLGEPDATFDGKVVGFEHKHYGRWGYEDILKKGLPMEVIAQVALYGDALGWDECFVVITSQDASSVRSDMSRNKKAKNAYARWADHEELDPKVTLFGVDIKAAQFALVPALKQRALWFQRWYETDGDPTHVKREHDDKYWAWDYSDWGDLARRDPEGTLVAPELPWKDD